MTTWREIPGWPYEASECGQIRNMRTGRVLRQQVHKSGYSNAQLWRGGEFWSVGVHQLVMLAHVGPPPPGHECRHLDGNTMHNHRSNLEYGTHLQNMRDRDNHGTTARNERNGKIKHPDETVAQARAMAASGLGSAAVARAMGLRVNTVHGWLKGRTR